LLRKKQGPSTADTIDPEQTLVSIRLLRENQSIGIRRVHATVGISTVGLGAGVAASFVMSNHIRGVGFWHIATDHVLTAVGRFRREADIGRHWLEIHR
jgi:hypothetical protein